MLRQHDTRSPSGSRQTTHPHVRYTSVPAQCWITHTSHALGRLRRPICVACSLRVSPSQTTHITNRLVCLERRLACTPLRTHTALSARVLRERPGEQTPAPTEADAQPPLATRAYAEVQTVQSPHCAAKKVWN